jgi:hypothetical protein
MRRLAVGILLACFAVTSAFGQRVIAEQFTMTAPAVPPVGRVTAVPTGILGSTTLYYWVIARYPIGVSIQQGPGIARGTQGVASLAMQPVTVTWTAAPGATGYDVIRRTTQDWPSTNACTNCVIASNLNALTFSDINGAVVNWPTASTVQSKTAILSSYLNNRDDSYPYIVLDGEYHIMPTRSSLAYSYLYEIGGLMTGGAAQKTYALGILVNRPTTAVATGDSNDAIIRGSYNNYAKNDANFIIRGVNVGVSNRSPGTLGMLDNLISSANRSGATSPIVNGLTVNVENFGVNATQHSAIDVSLKNEAAKATKEWAFRARNLNNSIGGPSDAVLLVEEMTLVNTGWNYIIDANGVKSPTKAFARLQNGSVVYYGDSNTRDAVRAEVGLSGAIGSMYLNTLGKIYLKIANANATGDWQSLTSVAAD